MNAVETLPPGLTVELDAELHAIGAASGAEGVSADYLGFAAAVARAQAKARAAIRAAVAGAGSASVQRQRGDLLSLDEVPFDDEVLLELMRDLECASARDVPDEQLQSLVHAAARDRGLLRRLAVAATLGDDARPLQEAADHLGMPVHALLLVARLLAAPFMVEARQRRTGTPELDLRGHTAGRGDATSAADPGRDDATSAADPGRCPTCGSRAGLAVLRAGDGARRLVCLLCGDAWLAPRLMCTCCGTRDQSKLGVLCVAADDPRWVETCSACHRYLKTVDQRQLPDGYTVVPRAEDARTLHLDLIAEREGHVRPAM
jgi:formate dehydrogenase maturation protein FdhE